MAGTRQFDEGEVLDRVMKVFWERGYEAASIDDIEQATGLRRGSLYNAFGGKEEMFARAFERYTQAVARPVRDHLRQPDPRQAIRGWLDAHLARMADGHNPRGCLATNSCLEAPPGDGPLSRLVRDNAASAESEIYHALLRAQEAGYLKPGQDLRALAHFLHGVTRGMAVLHKATGDLTGARDMADVAMAIFQDAQTKTH